MRKTLFIFGFGYTAQVLAKRLSSQGWTVFGTTRDAEKAAQLGIAQWPGDDVTEMLAQSTHVLISAAPNETGDPVLAALRHEFEQAANRFEWIGYLSTTGVYGDHAGGWVDETTPLTPSTKRGILRVTAEKQWMELFETHALPVHIFRLAGIYGPGRGPFAKVRNGTARRIVKKDQVFSRIHVDDIATVLAASFAIPNPGSAYNVCDDNPAPPQDVIADAARLLQLPVPDSIDFEKADLSPMAKSFYAESKRVSNHKIKQELGVKLAYPDYKTGLRALLKSPTV